MSRKENGYRIRQGFIPYVEGAAECSELTNDPTINSLVKKGNIVIFNFEAEAVEWTQEITDDVYYYAKGITIPKEFRPKEDTLFTCQYGSLSMAAFGSPLTYQTAPDVSGVCADGRVYLMCYGNGSAKLKIQNVCWEAK